MAIYSRLIITQSGQALLAQLISSGTSGVEFTKVCSSTATYTLEQLEALTSLPDIVQTSLVSKVTRTNNTAIKVEAAFTNSELALGYNMNTIGLYAKGPDGEILYAATVETSGNNYMPAYNGITVTGAFIQLITRVGNSENVSLNVNPAAVATIGDIAELNEKIADLQAYVGYTDTDIYGLEADFVNKRFIRLAGAANRVPGSGFNNINAFGGRRRCNVTNNGKVVAYFGDAAYSETGKLVQSVTISNGRNAGTYPAGTIVQVMVEQPKFYYKVVPLETDLVSTDKNYGYHLRKARYYVSDSPKAGFKIHPAFVRNKVEHEFIYLSAFEGSLWDTSASAYIMNDAQVADFANDMLCSIAGAKPMSGLTQNLTRSNVRNLAQKRGTGWEQAYIATNAATQLLMIVEYGMFNMQSAIGEGAVNKTDDGTTNMSESTGATSSLGNASGAVINNNGIQIISYRGEENPWGNIWTWVDGVNIKNPDSFTSGMCGNLYVSDYGFADNTAASPYEDTGIYPAFGSGFISAFGYSEKYDWIFIPSELTGNSSVPVGDSYWSQNPSWRVAQSGSVWADGRYAGAFSLYLLNGSASRGRYVGGRSVYIPSSV